ncbi:unnamed protein product [Phaeothamnion confervicola]
MADRAANDDRDVSFDEEGGFEGAEFEGELEIASLDMEGAIVLLDSLREASASRRAEIDELRQRAKASTEQGLSNVVPFGIDLAYAVLQGHGFSLHDRGSTSSEEVVVALLKRLETIAIADPTRQVAQGLAEWRQYFLPTPYIGAAREG